MCPHALFSQAQSHIMVGDEVGVEAEEVEGEGDKGIVVFLRCTFILL